MDLMLKINKYLKRVHGLAVWFFLWVEEVAGSIPVGPQQKKFFIFTRLIKKINEKKILCNKQIGFIRGCGTELNLLKLRQRVSDLKKEKNYFTKYLVFIDLKSLW